MPSISHCCWPSRSPATSRWKANQARSSHRRVRTGGQARRRRPQAAPANGSDPDDSPHCRRISAPGRAALALGALDADRLEKPQYSLLLDGGFSHGERCQPGVPPNVTRIVDALARQLRVALDLRVVRILRGVAREPFTLLLKQARVDGSELEEGGAATRPALGHAGRQAFAPTLREAVDPRAFLRLEHTWIVRHPVLPEAELLTVVGRRHLAVMREGFAERHVEDAVLAAILPHLLSGGRGEVEHEPGARRKVRQVLVPAMATRDIIGEARRLLGRGQRQRRRPLQVVHACPRSVAAVQAGGSSSSRRRRWIFPVAERGISGTKRIAFGALKAAIRSLACAISSPSVTSWPGFSATTASTSSP